MLAFIKASCFHFLRPRLQGSAQKNGDSIKKEGAAMFCCRPARLAITHMKYVAECQRRDDSNSSMMSKGTVDWSLE